MRILVIILVACLVVQAIRHGLEAEVLEQKIDVLENLELPKIPACEPKIIQIEKSCSPCEACQVCDCSDVHDWCYYENKWSNE